MTSPLPTLFGWHQTKQLDLDRPEGCDHDRNTYYYRLADGQMVLRGIVLGHGWEHRQMDWQGLSCYKRKEDDRMAKRQAPPYEELRQVFIDAEYKIDRVRKELKISWMDAKQWLKDAGLIDGYNRPTDKVTTSKAQALLESVDAGHIKSMGCIEPELSDKATEVVTAPLGVEVPKYEPEDNDYLDEPIPFVVGPDPLDAQIDVMLDALWAEKRAKLKAHLKPLLSDAEAWDMVKCIIARGLA